MRKLFLTAMAVAGLTAGGATAVLPLASQGAEVSVTVTYTGKGAVDDKHEILVFLFDHPTPTADSEPLASQATTKSGGTVTFKGVTQDPVYVVFVYDQAANYDGQSGPPPAGAPIGSYQKDGKPVPVKPGPAAKIKASFDDSVRWK
jgi:hypothetical protein